MKPESQTWEGYIYGDEYTETRTAEIFEDEFSSEIGDEVLQIIVEEMDVEDWTVTPDEAKVVIEPDGWDLTDKEAAREIRDRLQEVGDESVGVFVYPRDSDGTISDLDEIDHPGVEIGSYYLEAKLERHVEDSLDLKGAANDALSEMDLENE